MNKEVHLTKRILTPQGKRYCPAVLSANGRIKPDYVLVNGKPEQHSEGSYYIEWRDGATRHRLSVGSDAQDANARLQRKKAELHALNTGETLAPEENREGHRSLSTAVTEFLEEIRLTKKQKTYSAYSTALRYFGESCSKLHLEDIERRDLLKFSAFLRDEKGQSPRSVANKFEIVISFLKVQGIRGLVTKTDWPRYVEQEPEVYEKDELEKLFAACDPEEKLWYEFFLMTGCREQEVQHASWEDVNLVRHTVTVRYKPEYGFSPKAYKEREIPIPEKLVASLKSLKAKHDRTCGLVFPTAGCRPKLNFLDDLKDVARRAKLNPEKFWLHKFRATFATWSLWAGVDLRTVQSWLGHSDMESTLRYLKSNHSAEVRSKVNTIFG